MNTLFLFLLSSVLMFFVTVYYLMVEAFMVYFFFIVPLMLYLFKKQYIPRKLKGKPQSQAQDEPKKAEEQKEKPKKGLSWLQFRKQRKNMSDEDAEKYGCMGICHKLESKSKRYSETNKKCNKCKVWMEINCKFCPCCSAQLHTGKKEEEGREEL